MNYDWFKYEDAPWNRRYPKRARGYSEWNSLFEFEFGGDEWISQARTLFRSGLLLHAQRPMNKTVFISHRRTDVAEARKAAHVLRNRRPNPVDVWLDVEDPVLTAFGNYPGRKTIVEMLVTALVIEMALLNSSHVLAIFTDKTPGSLWVPYEYGRVKTKRLHSYEAASLRLGGPRRPEYMLLGPELSSVNYLNHWP